MKTPVFPSLLQCTQWGMNEPISQPPKLLMEGLKTPLILNILQHSNGWSEDSIWY